MAFQAVGHLFFKSHNQAFSYAGSAIAKNVVKPAIDKGVEFVSAVSTVSFKLVTCQQVRVQATVDFLMVRKKCQNLASRPFVLSLSKHFLTSC